MPAAVLRQVSALVILGLALGAAAQTNSTTACTRLFALPELHLRTESTPLQSSNPDPQPQEVESRSSPAQLESAELDTPGSDPAVVSTNRSDQNHELSYLVEKYAGALMQVRPPDDAVARFLDSTYRPEPVHVGKVDISCSILTAIKHKNPFCLLNPIFLNFSW